MTRIAIQHPAHAKEGILTQSARNTHGGFKIRKERLESPFLQEKLQLPMILYNDKDLL
jgi:hypothetical protein